MIKHIRGDITRPFPDNKRTIIAHVCNNIGLFGAGVAAALAERWPQSKEVYLRYVQQNSDLGRVWWASIETDTWPHTGWVANMVAMNGVYSRTNPRPLNYTALEACLKQVATYARLRNYSVHMPLIGTLRARGNWYTIYDQIEQQFIDVDDVYIYYLS